MKNCNGNAATIHLKTLPGSINTVFTHRDSDGITHWGRPLSTYQLLTVWSRQTWNDVRKILPPCESDLDRLTTQVSHVAVSDEGSRKTQKTGTFEQGRSKVKGRELQTPQTTAGESGNVRGVSQRHAAPILSPRLQAERRVFGTRGMFRELRHKVRELRREDEDLVLLQQKKKKCVASSPCTVGMLEQRKVLTKC